MSDVGKNWFKTAVEQGFIKSFEYNSFNDLKIISKGGFGTVIQLKELSEKYGVFYNVPR
ncbi:6696_t:CDS:2 [Dentiscutata heterogama]|uniref:6696_t:CDS:1 n=1 Tax=Dentiscutata heterogama TaxID=1316150 RepID=A0ACA9KPD1_9GLOM|nr:6696_t:CDS:2 [Dentiscutata heterogama]